MHTCPIRKVKAHKIIADFDRDGKDLTLNQFENAFHNKAKHGKFQEYIQHHISNLRHTGHDGNANCYERTLHFMQLFDHKIKS